LLCLRGILKEGCDPEFNEQGFVLRGCRPERLRDVLGPEMVEFCIGRAGKVIGDERRMNRVVGLPS
jgi:hypothetical protein